MVRVWISLGVAFFLLATPVSAAETLSFGEMYISSVLGTKFTPRLTELAGKPVAITGFMAPLLRVGADFFVLTKEPVSLCPFCNTDADWPADILVIYLKNGQVFHQLNRAITVTGRLEIGSRTDRSTGFVSLVRLMDAQVEER